MGGEKTGELLSITAYAKTRGVTRQYVQKLIKLGKISAPGGKIDRAGADAQIAALADPGRRKQAGVAGRAPPQPAPAETPVMRVPYDDSAIGRATAEDRQLSADIKRAKLAKLIGQQVDLAGALRAASLHTDAAVRMIRTLPDRMASRVAAESDPRKCHSILVSEVDAICKAVADGESKAVAELSAG